MIVVLVLLAAAAEVLPEGIPVESFLTIYVVRPTYPLQLTTYGFYHHHHIHHDIYRSPVIVLAHNGNNSLTAYYVDNGLRSIGDYYNFEPLYKLLRTSGRTSGLLLSSGKSYIRNDLIFESIERFIVPENLRLLDLMKGVLAVLYVAVEDLFRRQDFQRLSPLFSLVINDYNIDPLPLSDIQNGNATGRLGFRNNSQNQRNLRQFYERSHRGRHNFL